MGLSTNGNNNNNIGRHIGFSSTICKFRTLTNYGMFFQPNKRKGNSTVRIVDVAKKRVSNLPLPSPTPSGICCNVEQDEICEDHDNDDWEEKSAESESELIDGESSTQKHRIRKERLSSNWEKIRVRMLQFSLKIEGFVHTKCIECDQPVETRCRDCSYCAYYCLECCNNVHKNKLQFHIPEVMKVRTLIVYKPLIISYYYRI